MKTYSVLILLAWFLHGESASLAKINRDFSALRSRRVLASQSIVQNKRSPNVSETADKNYPHIVIDINYNRNGTQVVIHTQISLDECIDLCRSSVDGCVAINYFHRTYECHELDTVGSISAESECTTVLVNYADTDDPCNEIYYIPQNHRVGFIYEVFFEKITSSPNECCQKCKNDPKSQCVMWSYNNSEKRCYLHQRPSLLEEGDYCTTGFGVSSSSTIRKAECEL
eukprot:g3477.t1